LAVVTPVLFALADAANVRDGLMSALSLGITDLRFPEYPANLQAKPVLILQVDPTGDPTIDVVVQLSIQKDDESAVEVLDGTIEVHLEAKDGVDSESPHAFTVPIVVEVSEVTLPSRGRYTMRLTIAGEERASYIFQAA